MLALSHTHCRENAFRVENVTPRGLGTFLRRVASATHRQKERKKETAPSGRVRGDPDGWRMMPGTRGIDSDWRNQVDSSGVYTIGRGGGSDV